MSRGTGRSPVSPGFPLVGDLEIDLLLGTAPGRQSSNELEDGFRGLGLRGHGADLDLDFSVELTDFLVEIDLPTVKATAHDHSAFHPRKLARFRTVSHKPWRHRGTMRRGRLDSMHAPRVLAWLALSELACANGAAERGADPAVATLDPRTPRPLPALTEPMATPVNATPPPPAPAEEPDCQTRPRPARVEAANPPLLVHSAPEPVASAAPRSDRPLSLRGELAGPSASRAERELAQEGACAVYDRGRVMAALAEADLRPCRIAGDAPCGKLKMTIEPSGRISKVEQAIGDPTSRTAQCVRRYMSSRTIRFDRPACTPITVAWTYFVDR